MSTTFLRGDTRQLFRQRKTCDTIGYWGDSMLLHYGRINKQRGWLYQRHFNNYGCFCSPPTR
jgi:hypothetical protein